MSYPQPSVQPRSTHPLQARPLLPLEPPPHTEKPPLPSPQRTSLLDASFALTTHLVPAAFPRTTPLVPSPVVPTWSPDKAQWKAAVARTAEELLVMKEKQRRNELDAPQNRNALWVCVNRYLRKSLGRSGKGITLFFAHANGFSKELWEPVLLRLITVHQAAHAAYSIDEIWVWEAVNHGDACLVNGDKLGWMFDWQDNARDVLHFLLHYLPESASAPELPTHLPRLSPSISDARKTDGFRARTLVAIGHSLGGCTASIAALAHPALFSALVLVDPIIKQETNIGFVRETYMNVVGAVGRRDGWSSRDDARRQFAAIPFFAAWDPAVLDLYVAHGLHDAPDGGVKLKMQGIQEAIVFTEKLTCYETWDQLEQLDARVELRWVVPGKMPPEDLKIREALVWRRPANSSNIIIPSAGHLISQEAPAELAQDIHNFLERKYGGQRAQL